MLVLFGFNNMIEVLKEGKEVMDKEDILV